MLKGMSLTRTEKLLRAKWEARAHQLAKNNKGLCVALPKRAHDYGRWKCSIKNHPVWKATPSQVGGTKNKKGSWCPRCAPNARIGKDLQYEWAKRFQGKLIKSTARTTFKARWWCKYHGEFLRAYNSMKNSGTFCPECSSSLGERKCKAALEQMFGKKFGKKRFSDLRGLGGNPLEIDLYNEELCLGLEHHGAQHFIRKKFFGVYRFEKQQEHDRRRRAYCKSKGITLIEVRQVGEVTPDDKLKAIIVETCKKAGISLPKGYAKKPLNLDPAGLPTTETEMWARVKVEAEERAWRVVSKKYLGVLTKHEFICANNHRVLKKPMGLFAGEGCRICNKLRPVILEDGRLFESNSEAARSLNTTVSHISFAARRDGRTQGVRVASISHRQLALFRKSPKCISAFWKKQPPAKKLGAIGRPVLLSDGRIFDSIAAAAEALGYSEKSSFAVYNANQRGSLVGGLRIMCITEQQARAFNKNPKQKWKFWDEVPTYRRHIKPRSKGVVLSDGRIFSTVTDTLKAFGGGGTSFYRAIKTGTKWKGFGVSMVSQNEAAILLKRNRRLGRSDGEQGGQGKP